MALGNAKILKSAAFTVVNHKTSGERSVPYPNHKIKAIKVINPGIAYVLPVKVEMEIVIQQYEKAKLIQEEQLERLTQMCQRASGFEIRQLRAHLAQQDLDLVAERERALKLPHELQNKNSRFMVVGGRDSDEEATENLTELSHGRTRTYLQHYRMLANIFRSALQIIEGTCTDNRHYSITEIQFKTDTRRNEGPARKLTDYEEKGRHERWMTIHEGHGSGPEHPSLQGNSHNSLLDDLLFKGPSCRDCNQSLQFTLGTLVHLGWIINREKSSMTPAQHLVFLSIRFDTTQACVFLPKEKFSSPCQGIRTLKRPASLPPTVLHESSREEDCHHGSHSFCPVP
ncbi:unnamed protein product [Ranitomeya imitator]|uniref:Uncharacterized protein n=1 Tax=Ranitomeya imitator TaxID=111125 RepID=A0ABN9MDN6_9NEOB|nr:unnamed protein product [Ranitomeya imitator]